MKRRKQSKPKEENAAASGAWAIVLALALIALAACAAYHNSLGGDFVFDDRPWTIDNPSIRQLWPIGPVLFPADALNVGGRPMLSLTLAVNYALCGLNVWGYHVVNLAIHVLAAWALFGVVRRTLILPCFRGRFGPAATPLALIVALLWMLHPLQTESVSYVIQRTEALMGLFYLLVIYCVIRGATSSRSKSWYVAAVASCVLGAATKEVIVTAPVVVLLYDRTFLAGSFREAWRRRYGLYLALTTSWGMVAFLLMSTGFYGGSTGFAVEEFTWWSYLLTQPGVIAHYLRLAVWPTGLCLDYNWPPTVGLGQIVLPGLLIVGLLAATVWALVKRPAWGFLGAWFFVILAPTSSFVPIKDVAFEHRMYLPLAAVVAGVVIGGWLGGQWLVARGTIRPSVFGIVGGTLAAMAAVMLGTLTLLRNVDYQTEVNIWGDTVAKAPGNDRAHNNFGNCLVDQKRIEEAIVQYEETLKISPDYPQAHVNLGQALAGLGRMDEAIAHFRRATEVDPTMAQPHYFLGMALSERGQTDEAIACFRRALEIRPNYADAHNKLGNALVTRGKLDEAMAHYRQAIEIKPEGAEAYYNWGVALAAGRRTDEAIARFEEAIARKPDYSEAHYKLGLTLTACGRVKDAVVHLQKAVELSPDVAEIRNNLGIALTGCGKTDEAIVQFHKALELKADYAEVYSNLGLILSARGDRDGAIAHFRKALAIKPDLAGRRKNLAALDKEHSKE